MRKIFPLFIIPILGLLIGSLFYASKVKGSYDKLILALEKATFFNSFLNNDPALMSLTLKESHFSANSLYKEEEIRWRLLRNAGILAKDDLTQNLGCKVREALFSSNELANQDYLSSLKGLAFTSEFLSKIENDYNGSDSESKKDTLVKLMKFVFAGYPHSMKWFNKAVNNEKIDKEDLTTKLGDFYFPIRTNISKNIPINDVLGGLFSLFKIKFPFLESQEENCQQNLEEYRQITEVAKFILVSTNRNQEVLKARSWVLVYEGPMQWAMFVLFFTGCFFIFYRGFLETNSLQSELLAKIYDWIIGTIPVFGFIGTIFGLMIALRNADSIPLADGDLNAAIAISNITNTLSTAFTTTLIAFVLGVILSLINLIINLFFANINYLWHRQPTTSD